MLQCIMGKIHMGPPPPPKFNRLTNMCENITFPHTTYAGSNYPHMYGAMLNLTNVVSQMIMDRGTLSQQNILHSIF